MADQRKLEIKFRGRVIEHLGIDMYQSPVAAIAELISNSWDADANKVAVTLPSQLSEGAELVVADNGEGMTFTQCQERYLEVGYNRRKDRRSDVTKGGRSVMGRKGIGKFAGFGIASIVEINTTSSETGERTVFVLDVDQLIRGEEYANKEPMDVDVLEYLGPDESRKEEHGTKIVLKSLTLKKKPNVISFRRSMARRFLLMGRADQFNVEINDVSINEDADVENVEFEFPADYPEGKEPDGLKIEDGWGVETISNGHEIRWKFVFYKDTIADDELVGVSVFSHHKLAQKPFHFNVGASIGGQQGLSYLSGRVEAEFIDSQDKDLISTERQRINWESDISAPLLEWGASRVKSLLRIWQNARSEEKVRAMNERISPFTDRLEKLEPRERKIIKRALTAIARISILSDDDFDSIANSMLAAWEKGRLKELIEDLADAEDLDASALVKILAESEVMNSLHAAERVRAQLTLIQGLEKRVQDKELELAVRDYIAENPWMISPEWDTFRVEKGMDGLLKEFGKQSLDKEDSWNARVDLVLTSGRQLLVVEFMRPGVTADWDHVYRFERYVLSLREAVIARHGEIADVTGLMVADKLDRPPGFAEKLRTLRQQGLDVSDWAGLLEKAKRQWQDYFDILYSRAPQDERMQDLATSSAGGDDTMTPASDGAS